MFNSRRLLFAFCILALTSEVNLHATVLAELEVGDANDAFLGSAAIGTLNLTSGSYSIAVGYDNNVGGYFNASVGSANTLEGGQSLVVGNGNHMQLMVNPPICSLVVGDSNLAQGRVYSSIIVGFNNVVHASFQGQTEIPVDGSATFGRGLVNKWNSSLVTGQYNSTTPPSTLLFAIGNGVDGNNRTNAMEVYKDGKVIIRQAQGDILMGEFGN
jgi:hypothetical protein